MKLRPWVERDKKDQSSEHTLHDSQTQAEGKLTMRCAPSTGNILRCINLATVPNKLWHWHQSKLVQAMLSSPRVTWADSYKIQYRETPHHFRGLHYTIYQWQNWNTGSLHVTTLIHATKKKNLALEIRSIFRFIPYIVVILILTLTWAYKIDKIVNVDTCTSRNVVAPTWAFLIMKGQD